MILNLILCLFLPFTEPSLPDDCDDFRELYAELDKLREDYSAEANGVTFTDVRFKASETLLPMKACFEANPASGDKITLYRNYLLGRVSYDAEELEEALMYFELCQNHRKSREITYNATGESYYDLVRPYTEVLLNKEEGVEGRESVHTVFVTRVVFGSSKTGIEETIAQTFNDENIRQLTSFDIEKLAKRKWLIASTEKNELKARLEEISGTSDISFMGPFVIVTKGKTPLARSSTQTLQQRSSANQSVQQKRSTNQSAKIAERVLEEEITGRSGQSKLETEPPKLRMMEQRAVGPSRSKPASTTVANRGEQLEEFRRHLMDNYFLKDPEYYIPIYLYDQGEYDSEGYQGFSDFANRVHLTRPFGRLGYSNHLDGSVMAWMQSGFGTVQHEVVHALMAVDFPGAPGWLNEGLATYYEETRSYKPLDNYRLVYLQTILKSESCFPGLKTIFNASRNVYAEGNEVKMYMAAARYLVMYLDEKGVMQEVYTQLRDLGDDHPESQFGVVLDQFDQSVSEFEKDWKEWVLARPVPRKWSYHADPAIEYLEVLGCGN